jgi:trk system potassium uptake protein TrkH
VTRLPAALVPLAKRCDDDPSVVDVFELVIEGQEIAPGYSELNDPVDQRQRLEEQARRPGTGQPSEVDEDFLTALFTAVSATCVTGLAVVDTATYWTGFGQFVIFALFQIGGLGIMTGGTILSILMSRKISLQNRMLAQAETHAMGLGDVTDVAKWVLYVTLSVELIVAGILAINFHLRYDEPIPRALWNGLFHSVSSFNNAGFSTYSDNLMQFVSDPIVLLPIALALIAGGIFSTTYFAMSVISPRRG